MMMPQYIPESKIIQPVYIAQIHTCHTTDEYRKSLGGFGIAGDF